MTSQWSDTGPSWPSCTPSSGSCVLNQFPSIVMFGMKGFYISASGAIQGHNGPLVVKLVQCIYIIIDLNPIDFEINLRISKEKTAISRYIFLNPFPNKPWFLRVCSASL